MASRLKLHEELVEVLGSRYVYFQPPESIKMNYPAIVYERYDIPNRSANNDIYLQSVKYTNVLGKFVQIAQRKKCLTKCAGCGIMDNLGH